MPPTSAPPASASANSAPTSPSGSQDGRTGALSWIIGGSTLTQLRAADTAGNLTKQFFDTPRAYVITNPKDWSVPDGWTSTPTASFTSYAALQAAVSSGKLDPRIRAVLYDNESWSQTPVAEQRDPAHYDQLAAHLVHQHHLLFIATPAVDLTKSAGAQDRYSRFLASGLVGSIAGDADVIDIQAQGSEMDVAKYEAFVSAAVAQARRSNPGVKVLAGISTNPTGQAVTTQDVVKAIGSVQGTVDGYWLNDPARSAYCPTCAGPFPQVSLGILSALAVSGKSG